MALYPNIRDSSIRLSAPTNHDETAEENHNRWLRVQRRTRGPWRARRAWRRPCLPRKPQVKTPETLNPR